MTQTAVRILFVDDDEQERKRKAAHLTREGYAVITAAGGAEARELLHQQDVQAMIVDWDMPGESGLDVLRWMKKDCPQIPVILYTGFERVDVAVEALKLGAYDFIIKGSEPARLLVALRNAVERFQLESRLFQNEFGLIGRSAAMQKLWKEIRRVAATDARVLIMGETGSGKDLVARAIHGLSRRKERPFLRVTCPVITETLGTSELFGYKKGSHATAYRDEPGKFKAADGGTVFLDEIGDAAPQLQARLLTVVQSGEIEPVGGRAPEKVDVRIIACTNRDLKEDVREKRFREDLYYRLDVCTIHVPPLRERCEDIGLLVNHFLIREALKNERTPLVLEPEAIQVLMQHDWPGNVRDLENLATKLTAIVEGDSVSVDEVCRWLNKERAAVHADVTNYELSLQDFERQYFRRLYDRHEGNVTAMARESGLHRATVHSKLKVLGIGGKND